MAKRRLFDFNHPFFRPLWRRVAVVAVSLGWAAFEFISGTPFWGMLFGAIGLAAAWGLFVVFEPRNDDKEGKP